MPTIAFQNDGIDGLRVLSTMYFPLDEAKRTRLLCDFADQVGASITPGQHTVESRVRDSRPWAIAVSEAGWRGTTAGEGLLRLALLCVNDSGEPSMRKVVASLQRHAIDLATDPRSGVLSDAREDRQIPITEKSMWNYLAEYKSVCHLWAAHRILERSNPITLFRRSSVMRRSSANFLHMPSGS